MEDDNLHTRDPPLSLQELPFCQYSFNLDQSVPCFGILPVCQMFYVKSSGLLHCLCIFLMLLKKRTFCITLLKFFICMLQFSCSTSESIPSEPVNVFLVVLTYLLSHILQGAHEIYFFLFSEVNTHTNNGQNPINHIIDYSITANWNKLKCFSYLLISILSDIEFTSLALLCHVCSLTIG